MPRLPFLAFGLITTLSLSVASALADEPSKGAKGTEAQTAASAPAHSEAPTHGETKPADTHAAPAAAGAHSAPEGHAAPAATAGGHDAGHGSGDPNILEPQPSLAIWTVAVFVVLLLALKKFAWGPIIQALHEREEHMQHTLLEAERARNEAERIMVENRKQLAHATDQVRELIEKGRADAQAAADAIMQKAHAEAEASLHRAEREIQTAKDSALTEIFSKSADLAVTVAGKVLSKQLDANTHKQLVEAAIAELPSSSNGHGG